MVRYSGWFSLLILSSLMCLLTFAQIPRISRITGYVNAASASIKIFSPQAASVKSVLVSEGSAVRKGDLLFSLTAERLQQNGTLEQTQSKIVDSKKFKINAESVHLQSIESAASNAVQTRIELLEEEVNVIVHERSLVQQRVADLQRQFVRQQELVQVGFASREYLENKSAEGVEQQLRISALDRSRMTLQREIRNLQADLKLNSLRATVQRSQLQREDDTLNQEINELQSKQINIFSPVDGVVTQLTATLGQTVKTDIALLNIVPTDAKPEILLYAPSRSVGFIREGQTASIRYHAFPFEHYGRHVGVVKSISKIALPPQEIPPHIAINEAVFAIRVALPEGVYTTKHKKLTISQGMLVDADVELDRLRIYQWLLQPLYRLGGRL